MKKTLIILLFFLSISLNATTYYVATSAGGGSDSNPGTFTQPWGSLLHAFTSTSVQPGDTVFIRGGIYYIIENGTGIRCTRNGTSDNWIVYANYPGEEPIMDFGNIVAGDIAYTGLRHDGIVLSGVNYIKMIGLTVRNVKQYFNRNYSRAVYLRDGIVTIERFKVYNNMGHGVHSNHTTGEGGVHRIIDTDSYNNCDSISGDPLGSNAGATGNGYAAWSDVTEGETYFINCRAWGVSDQGFSVGSDAYVKLEGCWSFNNKPYISGGGGGFKLGYQLINVPDLRREVINCVAAYNGSYGFFTNENGSGGPSSWYALRSNHYNNIAYHNGFTVTGSGYGFLIQNTQQSAEVQRWRNFSNNVSYGNYSNVYNLGGSLYYSGSNNSWDIPLTMADADFASIDTTGMTAPRQADGSLPDNNFYNYFLKLSDESVLINEGIDVGLPYVGVAPDLGPFEWSTPYAETGTDIVGFSFTSQTNAATINATTHTVAIEVAYTADITSLTPTITLSYGATVIPTSGVARDFTNPVPYTVTAEDGVTYQEWTVTVTQGADPEEPPVETGPAIVKFNGKIVKR